MGTQQSPQSVRDSQRDSTTNQSELCCWVSSSNSIRSATASIIYVIIAIFNKIYPNYNSKIQMNDQLKYQFSRRTQKTSIDPYDSLTANRKSPTNLNHLLREENYSIWTNGETALLSTMPKIETDANGTLVTPISFRSAYPASHDLSNVQKSSYEKETINEVHEVRNSILAGSVAGMVSCTLFHPFDVIRTKIQTSTKLKTVEASSGAASSSSAREAAATLLRATSSAPKNIINSTSGPVEVFSHTMKNGGMKAFYTGFSFPLAAQAAYKSTVFTVNRVSQNALVSFKTREQRKIGIFSPYQLQPMDHLICGSLSGFVNALVFVSPVEYVRAQLIYQHTRIAEGKKLKKRPMNGPIDLIKTTLKSKGIFGLWRGAGVTILRDSTGCGCFFVSFEVGKKYLPEFAGLERDSTAVNIASGMMAGFGYWAVSLPLDALKTLVQSGKTKSAWKAVSFLVNRDGVASTTWQLYRGWQLAFGRGIPSAGVTLSTYAAVYHYCNTRFA